LSPLAAHADVCTVLQYAINTWGHPDPESSRQEGPIHYVSRFYQGVWPQEHILSLYEGIVTAFHANKLGYQVTPVEVLWAENGEGLTHRRVAKYFKEGHLKQAASSIWFFMLHHRGLWNPWTLGAFFLVSLLTFLEVVRTKVMRSYPLLIGTRAFWMLFLLNFTVTYALWVTSISLGMFEDSNLIAALLLALSCPTAVNALGELLRRHMPLDLTGIVRILNELNGILMKRIGTERLSRYRDFLKQYDLKYLKQCFCEIVLLTLDSEGARNRLLDEVKGKLKGLDDPNLQADRDAIERGLYAEYLITALGYICSNEDDIRQYLRQMGFGDPFGDQPADS
jgi:hypothetical protein